MEKQDHITHNGVIIKIINKFDLNKRLEDMAGYHDENENLIHNDNITRIDDKITVTSSYTS